MNCSIDFGDDDGVPANIVTQELSLHVEHAWEGSYFTIPFTMPDGISAMRLTYRYERRSKRELALEQGVFHARPKENTIDIGLIDTSGKQIGASGSNKNRIYLSEVEATEGYAPCPLTPGEWQIIVGAYKVAPEGVDVSYKIRLIPKQRRLLMGDLHTHTVASDGVLTAAELAQRAYRHGLDFLAITDHNQMVSAAALPQVSQLTLIPGVEWTHYQGHANFLGVDRPYDEPFFTNTPEETLARFKSARERGALITLNHPFEPGMGFTLDLASLPFDCLEVWNGPMRESNLRAVGFWQSLLQQGRKIPICGGSDYHRDTPFIFPGGPTTCVYALSRGPSDILDALRQGHAFIIFAPDGPTVEMTAGEDRIMGDSAPWPEAREMRICLDRLLQGDVVRVVTGSGSDVILQAPASGGFEGTYVMQSPGFARVEVLREFIPGVPPLPALLSNPIYFEASA